MERVDKERYPSTNSGTLDSVGKVIAYIERHKNTMGFPPSAIGLSYDNRVRILKEMGASDFASRCTNITAKLLDIPLVEVS
jgi:hypothetical protein